MKKSKGYTIIELLLVVSIIGILTAVALNVVNITLVQARSRDARRIGDIKKIQTALELYFTDYRGYPQQTTWENISLNTSMPFIALSPAYTSKMPNDPLVPNSAVPRTTPSGVECFNGINSYGYYYISTSCSEVPCSAGRYVLGAIMETETNASNSLCSQVFNCSSSPPAINCNSSGNYCYCVENPL